MTGPYSPAYKPKACIKPLGCDKQYVDKRSHSYRAHIVALPI